jgi:C1A family cysteine protease
MMLFLLFTLFANVFCQAKIQGTLDLPIFSSEVESFHWKEFSNFQERFSKQYSSIQELETRFYIFRKNFIGILAHNTELTQNFTMNVNQFTDLTPEEFRSQYINGGKKPSIGSFGCKPFLLDSELIPSSVDWRTKGVVNPVRDQGQCGSCWAFATTSNAESVWAISKGQLLDLSEEFLVDCASGVGYYNMGCNGGQPDSAFKFMINNGQCTEASYSYNAGVTKTTGTCQKCTSADVSFSSCFDVTPKDQVALAAAVAKQPVVVAIEADTRYFQSYSSGILDSTACGTNLDHAVTLIGYDSQNGLDYWIVRNSWSSSWGEDGYLRIKKTSSTNDIGVCGVAAEPSFLSV